MKKLFTLFTILSCFINFSQTTKTFDYQKNSNPNPKNELSLYFKKEIPKKLLRKARFLKNKENITISFYLNKENKAYNIDVASFGSGELNKSIIETFKKYPIEKLSIDSLSSNNRYSMQIINKKGKKNIFNCSSKIIIETPTICSGCEDLNVFQDIKSCLNLAVKKHFYENANFSLLDNINEDETNLFIQFSITKFGELKMMKKTKVPLNFVFEVDKTLSSFPKIKEVGTLNGDKINAVQSFSISFKKGVKPTLVEENIKYNSLYKPSIDNDLSVFFIKNLDKEFIDKANLNRINNNLMIHFELDKKDKLFNLSTNSRSNSLNEKIIKLFKKYPLENLTFLNRNNFDSYFIQILTFTDNEIIVKANSIVGSETIPIFPGCENSIDLKAAKNCFSKGIQLNFMKKFDADLPNRLGLSSGKKRVFIGFKINKNGNIVNIQVKAPHQKIKEEVIRVMQQIPRIKPGTQGGKPVNVKYSIPFTLIIN